MNSAPPERIDRTPSATRADGRLARRIVEAYDDWIVRAYCRARFSILRDRFLFEIGQYLPHSGRVLDVGCGFGLFALYFAATYPGIEIHAFDLNERRIGTARRAAARLGIDNVVFRVADAARFVYDEPLACAYMLDLVHHLPPESVPALMTTVVRNLRADGCLIVKDIEPSPAYKLAFTWLLDKAMDVRAPVRYWAPGEIHPMLESLGLRVRRHRLLDYLPYPHVLYVASRSQR